MIISMFHVILFRCINNTKCLLPSGLVSLGSRLCASLLQYRQQIAESPGAAAVTDGRVSGSSRHLSRAASVTHRRRQKALVTLQICSTSLTRACTSCHPSTDRFFSVQFFCVCCYSDGLLARPSLKATTVSCPLSH